MESTVAIISSGIFLVIMMIYTLNKFTKWVYDNEEADEKKLIDKEKYGVYVEKWCQKVYLRNVEKEDFDKIKEVLEKYDCKVYSRF